MRISSVNFTSLRTVHKKGENEVQNCNYTNFNREDLDWGKFAQFARERFKNQDKVNVNFFGASDGSEVYTFLIAAKNNMAKKDFEKFIPVNASDISKEVIESAKNGEILLHKKDIEFLKNNNALQFFEPDFEKSPETLRGMEFYPYKVKEPLKNMVNFSVKNIKENKENFSDGIVFFRNGWTFNSLEDQDLIAKNLYKNSNPKTLVVIGQSDLFKSASSDLLQENGFVGVSCPAYLGKETNYPSNTIGQPKTKPKYPEFTIFEQKRKIKWG